jgi:hypothetical protein
MDQRLTAALAETARLRVENEKNWKFFWGAAPSYIPK